jgi:hypothetical protein
MIAGAANEIVKAGALATKDEDAVAGEVELVVVGDASFVEADDPDVLLLQFLKGAHEVDDASDAQVLGCSGTGLDGHGAQRGGATLGQHNAVDSGSVGNAEKCAQILRIFYAVKREEEALLGWIGRGE